MYKRQVLCCFGHRCCCCTALIFGWRNKSREDKRATKWYYNVWSKRIYGNQIIYTNTYRKNGYNNIKEYDIYIIRISHPKTHTEIAINSAYEYVNMQWCFVCLRDRSQNIHVLLVRHTNILKSLSIRRRNKMLRWMVLVCAPL